MTATEHMVPTVTGVRQVDKPTATVGVPALLSGQERMELSTESAGTELTVS